MRTWQLLLGLEYLYVVVLVHTDVKTANYLFEKQGTLKLSDFGCEEALNSALIES